MQGEFVAVVPVKPPGSGKSRLQAVPPGQRRALASAFAVDTVTAALAAERVGRVLVATDDAEFARILGALGCVCVPDGGANGLNAALVQAAAEAARRWPRLKPAALLADLPALRSDDLDLALAAAVEGAWFVADAEGTGTTMYVAPAGRFAPQFGPGSAQSHLDDGVQPISEAVPSLRRDVDDLEDLQAAIALGVGTNTRHVLASHDLS